VTTFFALIRTERRALGPLIPLRESSADCR